MEQFCNLLEIVAGGNGSRVLVAISNADIKIESDTRSSIFAQFVGSLPSVSALFVTKPSFYEKLGLLHVRRIAFDGSYDKFGCLVSGVLKPLVKERLLQVLPAFVKQSHGEHVLCAGLDEIRSMRATMGGNGLVAVPPVFAACRSAVCSVVVRKSIFKSASIIGQFNREFIIVSYGGSVFAIDQHALHERILLEGLLSEYEVDMYAQSDGMEELKSMACRNAVKFGQEIAKEKLLKLVRSMVSTKFPTACAHGRISVCALIFTDALQNNDMHSQGSSV